MSFYSSILRPLAFMLEPESAHNLAMALIRRGLIRARATADPLLAQSLFGVEFPNPVGLAAGFDKNAVAVERWQDLGFGFAEVGTVTYHRQPGNPKPRLFRLPPDRALINRMGFNNDGAGAIAERLARARPAVPIGVNLGKSKVTELERAPADYGESFRLLRGSGAYFVVNVSSPNTPGLRTLQERGPLVEIIQAIRAIDAGVPLFVKVSPDLDPGALDEIVEVAHENRLTGLIATNTTLAREGLSSSKASEGGGLSGAPLKSRSNEFLAHLYRSCDRSIHLIGVGGIFDADDVYVKIALGAHLCQIYTGWVYGGPSTVPRLLAALADRMRKEGIASLAELRGSRA